MSASSLVSNPLTHPGNLQATIAKRSEVGLRSLLAVLSIACATRPTTTRTMCSGRECYDVGPLGPEWKVVTQKDGTAGFFNATNGGIIVSNATCRDDAEGAPLSSLTAHMLVGYTERHERSRELLSFGGREALRSVIEAKLDGVPVVLDLYVLKSNGCIFDLSYAAPPAGYESRLGDFRRFVEGFRQLPRPPA